jgi:hypothetical protein
MKSWFFEKSNKIDKLLANRTKKKREKTQLKSEMKRGTQPQILTKFIESLQGTLKTYFQVNWKIQMKWTNC